MKLDRPMSFHSCWIGDVVSLLGAGEGDQRLVRYRTNTVWLGNIFEEDLFILFRLMIMSLAVRDYEVFFLHIFV